ncbi:MAG: hypothetical protein AVDCRST_MAG66-4688, partial [uncultured Pseudonocardia sp.]
ADDRLPPRGPGARRARPVVPAAARRRGAAQPVPAPRVRRRRRSPAARRPRRGGRGRRGGHRLLPFERGRAGVGRALAHDVSDYQGVVHAPGLDWHGPELLKACAVWPRAHHGRRLGLVRGRDPGRPQPGHAAHRPVLQDPARRAAPRRRPIARGPVYDQAGGDQRVQPRPHHTSSAAV